MTIRQRLLKAVYPLFVWYSKKKGKNAGNIEGKATAPPVPFYSLRGTAINGSEFDFASLKGKKVLLVNTASDCGYTGQYDGLEQLWRQYQDRMIIIGFPANDFKEQEKGSNEDIEQFCKINYGVSFPLMQKSSVVEGPQQNPVYQWLTSPQQNGWNKVQPSWNFSKYLVNEQGQLIHYFGPAVEPMSDELISEIKK